MLKMLPGGEDDNGGNEKEGEEEVLEEVAVAATVYLLGVGAVGSDLGLMLLASWTSLLMCSVR